MNKKYKREHEQKKYSKMHRFEEGKVAQNYSNLLNGDIPKSQSPEPKQKIDESKQKIKQSEKKQNVKSRNSVIKESKTENPKAFGRKQSSSHAQKSIADQLIDGIKKYDSYVCSLLKINFLDL